MKIGVLGTGMVGQVIVPKMVALGHHVFMGTRDADSTRNRTEPERTTGVSFVDWFSAHSGFQLVSYADIPSETDLFINASHGETSIEALESVGKDKLAGKIILDLANALDFSKGMPPTMLVCNNDSLGEQIQRTFPHAFVVKSLNTMNCTIMMDPSRVQGDHNVFMSGNDSASKHIVKILLESIGWSSANIIDLGDITTSRGTEMMLPVWIRLWDALGTPEFNFHIARN